MTDYPNLCEACNIGQLNFVAKSSTGNPFVILKCFNCDSVFKYENGLLFLTSKGMVYTMPGKKTK